MSKEYVTKIESSYRVAGTRVSLGSLVYAWRDGASPETIADMFPVLTLEEVYGAVTFYLGNQEEVDKQLRQAKAEFEANRRESTERLRQTNPELYRRLMSAKERKAMLATTTETVLQ